MSKDSFQFYRSFFQTIDALPITMQRDLYRAIALYGLNEEEMELGEVEQAIWYSFKAQLDANWRRYYNGKKGGAPKGTVNNPDGHNQYNLDNQRITKNKPKDNQRITKGKPNSNTNSNTNRNRNNDYVVIVADAEKMQHEFLNSSIKIQNICMNLKITQGEYQELAKEVIREWQINDAKDWGWHHFMSTMRKKVESMRNKPKRPKSYQENKAEREADTMRMIHDFLSKDNNGIN